MAEKKSKEKEIIKLLFKDFSNMYNSRSISKLIGISHAGAFKILKRLEKREIVIPKRIGRAVIYSLNINNPVALREIEMALTIEAQEYKRWIEEFSVLKENADFAVLFGSLIKNEKQAKDIDILIVSEKEKAGKIRKTINEKNKIMSKKIHLIIQTKEDFDRDIGKRNKAMFEILKTGIVLFGQEKISQIIKEYIK